MFVDVSSVLRDLAVDDRQARALGEAQTVLRVSRAKCPRLGKNESLRSYVAIDLALGKLGIQFSRDKLIKAANSREKVYNQVYRLLRNVLGAQVVVLGGKIEQLAVKFAGGSVDRSRILLRQYQEACRSTVTADKRDRLDFDTPLYHAAAFRVATVEAKMKVDRKLLAQEVKMEPQELDKICADLVKKCGLVGSAHVARAFRISAPGSGDRDEKSRSGARKRPLTGARSLDESETSPSAAATTMRLIASEESPSAGAPISGAAEESTEKRLDFTGAMPTYTNPPRQAGAARPPNPRAPLHELVKRLRRLESPAYEEWVSRCLSQETGSLCGQ